ncbi:sensor domain-containing diguanylate cyclase [Acetobacterium tundrae]|nr:sensor domain-containing diguanylate cyclase [Acetobacterium tundrae]
MLSNDAKAMINYVNGILNDKKLNNNIPAIAESDADFLHLNQSLRTIRNVAEALSVGDIHHVIQGDGFVLDSFQRFQKDFKRSQQEVPESIASKNRKSRRSDRLPLENRNRTAIKNPDPRITSSEDRHRLLTDNACDMIATLDLSGNFTYISPSVKKMTGYTQEEVLHHYREIGYFLPGVQKEMDRTRESIKKMVEKGEHFDAINFEQRQVRKDGESIYTDTVLSGIYDEENNFKELLAISRDITEKVKKRREMKKLSETDKLTQLYNRVKLDWAMENELDRTKKYNTIFALIMIDIDHFKQVNDRFGHLAGDLVLVELAELFKTSIRLTDIIGRWGGEEFLMILPDTDENGAMELAEKLRRQVSEKLFLKTESITISLGVAAFREDASVDSVIYRADQALYQAKNNGKNQVQMM